MGGAVFGGANKGCTIIRYFIVGCAIVDGAIVGRAGLHCQPRQHRRQCHRPRCNRKEEKMRLMGFSPCAHRSSFLYC